MIEENRRDQNNCAKEYGKEDDGLRLMMHGMDMHDPENESIKKRIEIQLYSARSKLFLILSFLPPGKHRLPPSIDLIRLQRYSS